MDFKKLKYFLTVAEEGHVTRAAEKLHIAQPPLTHQIKEFEKELGVQLVEKVGRQIRITKVGQALQIRGEQILGLVDKTVLELKDLDKGLRGMLSVGSVPSWGATVLPDRMVRFKQQNPGIRFWLQEGDVPRITDLLHNGVIELGVLPVPVEQEKYEWLTLPSVPIVTAMKDDWDNSGDRQSVSLLELADKPLIIHSRSKVYVEEYFRQHQVEADIICVTDDVRTMLVLANVGLGVALVPKIAVALVQCTNLIIKELISPVGGIAPAVIWMKNRYLSMAAKHFLETFSPEKTTG